MTSRLSISNNKTSNETSTFSNATSSGRFDSRPFVMQSKSDNSKQSELKTSLMQANSYGHHLGKTDLNNQSNTTVVQSKLDNQPIQLGKKRKAVNQSTSNRKKKSTPEPYITNGIKGAGGTGNEKVFNFLQGTLNNQNFVSSVSPNNPHSSGNIEKLQNTSRDKPVKGPNDLWGHGMNEPSGTRNIIPYTLESAGLGQGINPTSSFQKGARFNHLDIHQHIRTDTAKTFFRDGTGHPGAIKLDPINNPKAFHMKGNHAYDNAMDSVQQGTTTPAQRNRHLIAGHLNATAKPTDILNPNGPFTKGTTVTGEDLSSTTGKKNTAKIVGEQRNRLKELKIKTDKKTDMTNEPRGNTPPISPVDPNYPVSSPDTPIATDPSKWKEYINK